MSNDVTLACQMKMAERELGAFFQVVSQLHGPEEAEISAQDWLDELELQACIAEPTPREWRSVTIDAANRLSKRVSKQAHGLETCPIVPT
jgi:hypothetical protein